MALVLAAALQSHSPSCEQLLVALGEQDLITLTGFVGRDFRHNELWISDFGCGEDRHILLYFRYDDVRDTPEGRRAIEAIEDAEMAAIREGRLHVPNTGLKVRVIGRVAQNSTLHPLNVESLELVEGSQ